MYRWIALSLLLLSGCADTGANNQRAQNSAKIHTELAGLYFERAQMGPALSEVGLALDAKSNYAPAYNVRALVHMALHEDSEAEADFQHSLSLDKSDSETQINYGWFLCQRGKEKESITHFVAALKNPLYQTPEQAYLNAAVCTQKVGNNTVAEDFYQRALTVRPGLPQALLGMAQLNFAKENYGVARRYFNDYAAKNDNLTAEELWLAVRIERQLGDRNAVASYSMKLRNLFPDSKEARLLNAN
ncbi:MAG: type IV pilus biogenesis/stability protein PilW [Gallionella sp.]|jgi:type IV pilus assembly protein PilF|nr:type IV pilus biogenesis/stability protein PilW [Gallionella sp.]